MVPDWSLSSIIVNGSLDLLLGAVGRLPSHCAERVHLANDLSVSGKLGANNVNVELSGCELKMHIFFNL